MIEKHYTLRRADGGGDAAFSLKPDELKMLCDGFRTATFALGAPGYQRRGAPSTDALFTPSLTSPKVTCSPSATPARSLLGAVGPQSIRRKYSVKGLPARYRAELLEIREVDDVSGLNLDYGQFAILDETMINPIRWPKF